MKCRLGFITNSSSTCFILLAKDIDIKGALDIAIGNEYKNGVLKKTVRLMKSYLMENFRHADDNDIKSIEKLKIGQSVMNYIDDGFDIYTFNIGMGEFDGQFISLVLCRDDGYYAVDTDNVKLWSR